MCLGVSSVSGDQEFRRKTKCDPWGGGMVSNCCDSVSSVSQEVIYTPHSPLTENYREQLLVEALWCPQVPGCMVVQSGEQKKQWKKGMCFSSGNECLSKQQKIGSWKHRSRSHWLVWVQSQHIGYCMGGGCSLHYTDSQLLKHMMIIVSHSVIFCFSEKWRNRGTLGKMAKLKVRFPTYI